MTDAADFLVARMRLGSWQTWEFNDDAVAGGVACGEGQLLYGLVRALRPENVLEMGTAYGLSAIYQAAALRDNEKGLLHTCEIDAHRHEMARAHLKEAQLLDRVLFYTEPPDLLFDFVFLDAGHQAEEVRAYLNFVAPRLAPHAVVAVHDGCWDDHAARAAGEGWQILRLPGTSYGGLVLLQREG